MNLSYFNRFLAAFSILLIPLMLSGQGNIDSLYRLLKKSPSDPVILNNLAEAITEKSPETADSLAIKAWNISKVVKNRKEEARASSNVANAAWGMNDFTRALNFGEKAADLYLALEKKLEAAQALNDAALAAYEIDQYDVALRNYKRALRILIQIGDKQNVPSVLVNMGQVFEKTGQYDSAVYYYQHVIPLCQVPGLERELSSAYGNLGLVYKITGNYQLALENYSKALKISTTIGDKEFIATDLSNIGAIYVQWENFAMAKAYFRKALDIYQQNGSPDKVEVSLGNLGTLYQKEGKYDSALLFFRASLTIARKLERIGSIAVKLSNMGVIFYELGNFDSAIVCQAEALKISRKIGRMFPVCAALQNLGEIYLAKNDLKTARNYLEEAQTCAASVQAKTIQEKVFKSLSQLYERMGEPAKALANYKRYTALKDSMFTRQSQEKLAEMEARYLSEKKQQHIELLIKDKELRETSLRKHQLALYWVISGSLILLVSLTVISFLLKQKSKANRILVEKSMQLLQHEESNEIQAGINSSPAISDDEKSRLIAGLNKLIRQDKIFTRPQISLADLAEHLDTNTTYLSRIINEDFQHNFPNFINRLRIQEAQKMFAGHKYKSMTLEGIAGSVGFHSRSAFNLAFKKFTGVTPSVYIANLEKLSKPA